jgi:hypothetical protein
MIPMQAKSASQRGVPQGQNRIGPPLAALDEAQFELQVTLFSRATKDNGNLTNRKNDPSHKTEGKILQAVSPAGSTK